MKAEETSSEHPAPCNPWQNRASGKTRGIQQKSKSRRVRIRPPDSHNSLDLCVGGLLTPVYIFLLPSLHPQPVGTPVIERLRRMDLLGSLTLMGAFAVGVIGVNFAGAMYP
jgi:hypothetical protein